MQNGCGIYIDGYRPKSKKAVKEAVLNNPASVTIESTSLFGGGYSGRLTNAPAERYAFVGPDPHTKRSFYGTITVPAKPTGMTVQ